MFGVWSAPFLSRRQRTTPPKNFHLQLKYIGELLRSRLKFIYQRLVNALVGFTCNEIHIVLPVLVDVLVAGQTGHTRHASNNFKLLRLYI